MADQKINVYLNMAFDILEGKKREAITMFAFLLEEKYDINYLHKLFKFYIDEDISREATYLWVKRFSQKGFIYIKRMGRTASIFLTQEGYILLHTLVYALLIKLREYLEHEDIYDEGIRVGTKFYPDPELGHPFPELLSIMEQARLIERSDEEIEFKGVKIPKFLYVPATVEEKVVQFGLNELVNLVPVDPEAINEVLHEVRERRAPYNIALTMVQKRKRTTRKKLETLNNFVYSLFKERGFLLPRELFEIELRSRLKTYNIEDVYFDLLDLELIELIEHGKFVILKPIKIEPIVKNVQLQLPGTKTQKA